MKIELIIDKNCLSLDMFIKMFDKLAHDFPSHEIKMTSFENERQRLKELKINLLPAWLINNKVVAINPGEYEQLKKQILARVE